MDSINFNDGYRSYAINGNESNIVRIFVADLNLGKRLDEMFANFEQLQSKYTQKQSLPEFSESDLLWELDKEVRNLVNTAFGTDVCTPAFGTVNCCSPVGDGQLLIQGFMTALAELVKSDREKVMGTVSQPRPEVQKYLDSKPISNVNELTDEQKKQLLTQLLS